MLPVKCFVFWAYSSCIVSRTVLKAGDPYGFPGAIDPLGSPPVRQSPRPVMSASELHPAVSGFPKIIVEIVPKMLLLFAGVSWCASTYCVFTRIRRLSVGSITSDADPCTFRSRSLAGPSRALPNGPFCRCSLAFTKYVTAGVPPLTDPEYVWL